MAERPGIRINQNVRVSRVDREEDWYLSTIQGIGDKEFSIAVPLQGEKQLVLRKGDAVKIFGPADGAKVEFTSVVIGLQTDNIPFYRLSWPKGVVHIQQREFVRIPIVFEVYYAEAPLPWLEPVYIESNSLDLSGSGIRIATWKEYPKETHLMVKFSLPSNNEDIEFNLLGKVVRTWTEGMGKSFQVALKFIDINRKQQDSISHYIFNKMIEQRRLR